MVKFIEIDDCVLNVKNIVSVEKDISKYDKKVCLGTVIRMSDGTSMTVDKKYYCKIKNILKPIKLEKDDK